MIEIICIFANYFFFTNSYFITDSEAFDENRAIAIPIILWYYGNIG